MDEKKLKKEMFNIIDSMRGEKTSFTEDDWIKNAKKELTEELTMQLGTMEGLLDQLRLNVKYLLFDLESTRRENMYLRQLLEDNDEETV